MTWWYNITSHYRQLQHIISCHTALHCITLHTSYYIILHMSIKQHIINIHCVTFYKCIVSYTCTDIYLHSLLSQIMYIANQLHINLKHSNNIHNSHPLPQPHIKIFITLNLRCLQTLINPQLLHNKMHGCLKMKFNRALSSKGQTCI